MTNKYGVPISGTSDERQPIIQPKFSNRFRVFFYHLGDKDKFSSGNNSKILTGQVESVERPTIQYNNKPVHSFLGKGWVSGRGIYGNIQLTMRDDITNAMMTYFMTQLDIQTSRMYPVTSAGSVPFASNMLGVSPYFSMAVEIMDGRNNHTPLEIWLFSGCLVESLKPSNNSYENDSEYSTYSIEVNFESVKIVQPNKKMFGSKKYEDNGGQGDQTQDILQQAASDIRQQQEEASSGFMSRLNKIKDKVEDAVEDAGEALESAVDRIRSFF